MAQKDDRKLSIKIAGRFIDLLGHQMYGGPVPAVAEFIANAWDADAKKVDIKIPTDVHSKDALIEVRDFGEGMTFDELNKYYLNIGYERRKLRGERTPEGRLVMGRKGIGKLAGFGIAEDIELCSIKEGHKVQFNLNYHELKNKTEIKDFNFDPDLDEKTLEEDGVRVTLKNLKLERNINLNIFKKAISRRFALTTDEMQISINEEILSKEDLEFEFRTPADGWQEEEIEGFGRVKYWFGFLTQTIKDSELRGISVLARKRMAQSTPFFFNISGGFNGQVGIEYLTGQLIADNLDEKMDYIATDRHSINWQFGTAPLLEEWGQEKVKSLCRDWKKRKDQRNIDRFKHDYSNLAERINHLSKQEQKDVTNALDKIAVLERIQPDDFAIIAKSLIDGVERESVKKIIRKINSTDVDALHELYDAIKEWDIISAVSISEIITGKIEIIKKFDENIKNRLQEKSSTQKLDMQDFIKQYPWLLGQKFEHLKPADFHHELGVDKFIEEEIKKTDAEFKNEDNKEGRRFDLLCLVSDFQVVIIELMRPGKNIDFDHVKRLERYVRRIQSGINSGGTSEPYKNKSVYGILVGDNHEKDPTLPETIQDNKDLMEAVTWNRLFNNVKERYREYLSILRNKAPNDPRIKNIQDFGNL